MRVTEALRLIAASGNRTATGRIMLSAHMYCTEMQFLRRDYDGKVQKRTEATSGALMRPEGLPVRDR